VKISAISVNAHKKIASKAIVGKKIGMTQVFSPDGKLIPVTVIKAGPCPVVQKKTIESDGYNAIQVGFDAYPERRVKKLVNKPLAGHFKKANISPTRRLRELRLTDAASYEVGQLITVGVFEPGDKVDISGVSKGHGFTGAIYRWNQHTGPMAHGSKYHRGVGSMSANSTPSRVFKNKHMPGHYGVEKVTIQNLTVVRVDDERGLLLVRGAVPGPNGGYLTVRNTVRA
jgi:large subunit ribosomal protein L3